MKQKKTYIIPDCKVVSIAMCHIVCGSNQGIQLNGDRSVKSVGISNESYNSETDDIF
jgi:hypothetical protein